jgi:hypothetical protein
LRIFSCRWFKGHLLGALLELLVDPVPNVRLAALALLPALKQTIRLPDDVEQLVRGRGRLPVCLPASLVDKCGQVAGGCWYC